MIMNEGGERKAKLSEGGRHWVMAWREEKYEVHWERSRVYWVEGRERKTKGKRGNLGHLPSVWRESVGQEERSWEALRPKKRERTVLK